MQSSSTYVSPTKAECVSASANGKSAAVDGNDLAKEEAPKRLRGGMHSSSVWLLPGGVVEKRFGSRKDRFETEVAILERLKDCKFVPKLLGVDREKRVVRMTYCGQTVTDSLDVRKQIDKLLRILEQKYGVYRPDNLGKRVYQLGHLNNATWDGKRVYIIDFGSRNWKLRPQNDTKPIQRIKFPPHIVQQRRARRAVISQKTAKTSSS